MSSEERCVLKVENKTDWHSIYTQLSPLPYFETMTPTDYGHYHDRFLEIITEILNKRSKSDALLNVVEIGTSYGNTTLAYRYGLNWQQTGEFWNDDVICLHPVRLTNVTACDMSVPALDYGKRRGVFDQIFPHDFNAAILPNELVTRLNDGDLLVLIMISSYIKTLSLQRICFNFLGDRSKQKIIAYNDTCAFDSRNLSPECIFAGVKGWTTSTHFTKHRNFTPEESALQHGCKESWSYTYVVTFEALPHDQEGSR